MKTRIYNFLNKPYAVILIMLIAPIFGLIDRNFVFFFGLGIAFFLLRESKFNWAKFGITQKINKKTVLQGLLIAFLFFILFSVFISPILQNWFGDYNFSSIEDIRGNLIGYLILMVIMWVFAAFGEEFLFRGYYMKTLAEFFGNNNKAWILSALLTSIYFGVSHAYQGVSGVIGTFLWSFFISVLFYKNKNNLLLLVMIHGFYDSIGLTLIFLNKDHLVTDLSQLLF